jgi:ABC-type transport system involved in multi-copper enzyme maturation permease subunit
MSFWNVVVSELGKLRRATVTWMTFAAATFMAAVAGLFLWMMKNPGLAERLGLFGRKATLTLAGKSIDWPTFVTFIQEMGGIGGLILCSIVVTYVFGREYAEGTAKNLLALPVPRSRFVAGKLVVASLWYLALTLWLALTAFAVGTLVGLPGLTGALLLSGAGRLLALAGLSMCCSTLVAWVAVEARGYFAPLGFSLCTLALASVFGHTGWADWVPWSIIGLYSGAAGPVSPPGWGSLAVIGATFLLGTGLTLRHEVWADNGQ